MKVLKFIGRLIWCIIAILAIALVTCWALIMFFGFSGEKLPWRADVETTSQSTE